MNSVVSVALNQTLIKGCCWLYALKLTQIIMQMLIIWPVCKSMNFYIGIISQS